MVRKNETNSKHKKLIVKKLFKKQSLTSTNLEFLNVAKTVPSISFSSKGIQWRIGNLWLVVIGGLSMLVFGGVYKVTLLINDVVV